MNAAPKLVQQTTSPDDGAAGLVGGPLDPLRYGEYAFDPDDVSGIATRMIPLGARVLDVGCGRGSLGKIVAEIRHADVVGIEPEPTRAEAARAHGLKVYTGLFTRELIHEIGLFDIVLLADVLEHLRNPQAMLLLSREALQPGGAIIVSVPNVAHWSVRANLIRGKFQYEQSGIMDATHVRWFTAGTIKALVSSSGFKVTEYRATACWRLIDNANRRPLSWLPDAYRASFLRLASRRWPTLFGAQHVLKAEAS